jgi:hypothetical protein
MLCPICDRESNIILETRWQELLLLLRREAPIHGASAVDDDYSLGRSKLAQQLLNILEKR